MPMVLISNYLVLSAMLFLIGVLGVLFRRSALIIFMSIELMLNAVNLSFVAFARLWNDADGHMFVMFILTVAAAEAAVGLAIVIALFRQKDSVDVDEVNLMKG
jgi:NADH-quinone oxidoreductase subunit K